MNVAATLKGQCGFELVEVSDVTSSGIYATLNGADPRRRSSLRRCAGSRHRGFAVTPILVKISGVATSRIRIDSKLGEDKWGRSVEDPRDSERSGVEDQRRLRGERLQ